MFWYIIGGAFLLFIVYGYGCMRLEQEERNDRH